MSRDAFKRFSSSKFMHYDVIFPGFKFNMPDLNAVLGIEQLKKLDSLNAIRGVHAMDYIYGLIKDLLMKDFKG